MRVGLDGRTVKGIQLYGVYRDPGIQRFTVYCGIHSSSAQAVRGRQGWAVVERADRVFGLGLSAVR